MGLRHLLGVDQDDAPPARRAEPTRSIGSGDILETASSGPLLVETVLALGSLGVLCVAGDAIERRVLLVRIPTCWRLAPATSGTRLAVAVSSDDDPPGDMRRVAGGVLEDGRVLEVFADEASIVVVVGAGRDGRGGVVLSTTDGESSGEPVIWLPGGVAPAGIDDSYLALDAGVAEQPLAPSLLDTLGARERPIT